MGSLQRILKNFFALFVANIASVANSILLAPIFLHHYGKVLYGEWIALSVGVGYLRTLNFGVQTYVNQDLALRFHRGEIEDYHRLQSTALRLLTGICGVAAVLCGVVFFLQPQRLLRLTISNHQATFALYFLALQVLVNILFGYFSGIFMVPDKAHRGTQWNNFQRIVFIGATVAGVCLGATFATLALLQLLTYIVCLAILLIDLKRVAPAVFPSLRHWDPSLVKGILKGSGHFSLIFSCNFLVFEAPILILQRVTGPVAVVAFYLMRTMFSMVRQMLAMFTQALGPEITSLFAKREWMRLRGLYIYSEKLIFAGIPTVSIGVLVASPWLLTVWHVSKASPFELYPYVLSAAIAIVMATEEHKYQFQYCTNSHEKLARFMFSSYVLMVAASVPLVQHFGLMGFLGVWLATESSQLAYIVHLNHVLFDPAVTQAEPLAHRNLLRLLGLSVVGLVAATLVLRHTAGAGHGLQVASAILMTAATGACSYVLFDLKDVIRETVPKIRQRFTAG